MDPSPDIFQEPARVSGCMNGQTFGSSILNMPSGRARELVIYQQLYLGNIPEFLRTPISISVSANGHCGTFWAMPDYLAIGEDDNFLRMPMRPTTAQKAADRFGACLPTRKMVNDVWRAALLHVSPSPMDWHGAMASVSYFGEHNARIQQQIAGRDLSKGIAGHKKDVVICKDRPPGNVAIYGWHKLDGHPIQDLQAHAHDIPYLDYSHGIRFVHAAMEVDGELQYVHDVLCDAELHELLSDEGVYSAEDVRYSSDL